MALGGIITALFGISLAGLVRLALTAPLGWEDRNGFHVGPQPENDAGAQNTDVLSFAPVPFFHSLENNDA